jgi:hypothetical protein
LDNWHDHSVYKNDRGEIIPEIQRYIFAIKGYFNLRQTKSENPIDI